MTSWTQPETDLLVSLWNSRTPVVDIIEAMPRHGTESAIKKRLSDLRRRGVDLASRRLVPMPPEEARRRKLAAVNAWRLRQKMTPAPSLSVESGWPDIRFLDDPRAANDHGSPELKIISQIDLSHSPSASSALWAVRG